MSHQVRAGGARAATRPWVRAFVLVTVGTLAASLVACNSSGGGSGKKVKIGLVTKTETNPFFVKMREAAKAEAGTKNADLIALAGKFDGDNEGQVAAIENLVSQGVKGILITPNNSTGILGAIRKARDRGVVVIALDTATDPADAVDATFATDNKEAGRLQGAWVKAARGTVPAKVAMLDGTAGGTVDTFRHDGFLAGFGLTENDPSVVGKENTNGDQAKAQTAMENLLQRNGDINVVYTINEPAARGAYEAIKAKGREKAVIIGSIDGSCAGVADVKAGKVGATVMQFPRKMAAEGVDAVVEFAASGKKPAGFHNTGAQLITDQPQQGLDAKDTAWGVQNCWG
ncbi:MAG TPA: substrate-binding domain-containing protein [Planosporangium sp.]|jgi:fructose transport system substrate-binding protein|nr:substrate-binding domain-containing protein [Planosporangium sp.]